MPAVAAAAGPDDSLTLALRIFGAGLIALGSAVSIGCSEDDAPTPGESSEPAADASTSDAARVAAEAAPQEAFIVGAPCVDNDDCVAPTYCMTPLSGAFSTPFGGGGPPNGICTFSCSLDGFEALCEADGNGMCVVLDESDPQGACLPTCTPGASDPTECVGRTDMACVPSVRAERGGFCQPRCEGDFQCDGGVCDLLTGVCLQAAAPAGDAPIGAPCTSHGDCDTNVCIDLGVARICSGVCAQGTLGCGFDPVSPDPLDSVCLFSASTAFREEAYCGQLCDCDADCRHPDAHCSPFGEDAIFRWSARGRAGYCAFAASGEVPSRIPCTSAGDAGSSTDAASDATGPG